MTNIKISDLRKNLKKPYTISIHEDLIRGIKYYKRTVPKHKLDRYIEDFINTIVPSIPKGEIQ